MRLLISRQFNNSDNQLRTESPDPQQQHTIKCIDTCLNHYKQIDNINISSQQIYLQLSRTSSEIPSHEIKRIYRIISQGQEKYKGFQKDKELIQQTDYFNHQSLIRVGWRCIQKLIRKTIFYTQNSKKLGIISKSVLNFMQLNLRLMKSFGKLKNSFMSLFVQIIQKLAEENNILEEKILQMLIEKGKLLSFEQLLSLNGIKQKQKKSFQKIQSRQRITFQDQIDNIQTSQQSQQDQYQQKLNNTAVYPTQLQLLPSQKILKGQSKKVILRRNKTFRVDFRYSWRQYKQQQTITNRRNQQIKSTFQKYIEKFFENQQLSQMLVNYNFKQLQFSNQENINQQLQTKISNILKTLLNSDFTDKKQKINDIMNIIMDQKKVINNQKNNQILKNTTKKQLETKIIKKINPIKFTGYQRKIFSQSIFKSVLKKNLKQRQSNSIPKIVTNNSSNVNSQENRNKNNVKKVSSKLFQFNDSLFRHKKLKNQQSRLKNLNKIAIGDMNKKKIDWQNIQRLIITQYSNNHKQKNFNLNQLKMLAKINQLNDSRINVQNQKFQPYHKSLRKSLISFNDQENKKIKQINFNKNTQNMSNQLVKRFHTQMQENNKQNLFINCNFKQSNIQNCRQNLMKLKIKQKNMAKQNKRIHTQQNNNFFEIFDRKRRRFIKT